MTGHMFLHKEIVRWGGEDRRTPVYAWRDLVSVIAHAHHPSLHEFRLLVVSEITGEVKELSVKYPHYLVKYVGSKPQKAVVRRLRKS